MASGLLLAAAPFLCLALNVAVQALLFRLRPSAGLLRSEYLGFATGLAGVGVLNAVSLVATPASGLYDAAGNALMSVITYAALGYCYFHFINLGETARRIRLLRELHEAGGSLSHQELLARYGAREIVERRIGRLLGTGQIVVRDQRYFIGSPLLVLIARLVVALKKLLLGKASEYEA